MSTPEGAKQDRTRQHAQALLEGARNLRFVLDHVADDLTAPVDLTITTVFQQRPKHPLPGRQRPVITVECTSKTTEGKNHCNQIVADLEKEGCKCKDIKNGQGCDCAV